MIKKILIYLSICTGFIFCFLFGKYINILALGNFDNSIGTIPIQMDIENYNTTNLVDWNNVNFTPNNATITKLDSNGNLIVNLSNLGNTSYTGTYFYLRDKLTIGETYTFSLTIYSSRNGWYRFGYSDNNQFCQTEILSNSSKNLSCTFIYTDMTSSLIIYVYSSGNINSPTDYFEVNNLMLVSGNEKSEVYSPYFKFGYNASLNYTINSSGSNTTVNYYFNDNTYTKTTSSVNGGYLIENYYLPFNIDSKGYVSLPNINFGISSISNNSSSITYSLQLELTPVFSAYYKGEYTTNIYTKLNYMSNDLFFSGITFSSCKSNSCLNNINAGNLSLTNPKILAVTEQNNTGNISTTNISTYYNDDIRNRNYFEFNNYLNVGFRIGDLAETYSFMNGRNYIFSISSLASRIVDNQTTTTPLPDNELTTDKYNTCSAWYDIPCQLGNAVTYVIYEAPIISPIVEFITTFIDGLQYVITYIKWFEGLGIVFSLFIFILMIRLLIMLIKGSNDDRGGNK